MKILVLQGSPNRNGSTALLCGELERREGRVVRKLQAAHIQHGMQHQTNK